jgi:3'-phosphoadenosine 5'-phosphosulfate sulfotransferase (PAPS reductase)/FAD synthetase
LVYTPIEDLSVDDVWTYLLQVPSPWGNNNGDLVTLYRNTQAGECPLVVDKTTPSCGNSRFGCRVCTVVTKDKSMEAMIENGEEWLEPMLAYRGLTLCLVHSSALQCKTSEEGTVRWSLNLPCVCQRSLPGNLIVPHGIYGASVQKWYV